MSHPPSRQAILLGLLLGTVGWLPGCLEPAAPSPGPAASATPVGVASPAWPATAHVAAPAESTPSLVPAPATATLAPPPASATAGPAPTAPPTIALADLPPPPAYAPEPDWPTDLRPTPFPPPAALPDAAGLALPAAPPLAAFAAALRPEFAGDLAGQTDRSLYQIAMRLDPARQLLLGHERIALTNQSATPLTRVVLRLYPNFPGIFDERKSPIGFPRLQVDAARVDGAPADTGYLDNNTAVAITLPQPLAPGARQAVELEFRLSTDGLGPAPDTWYFKSFYPLLPVYDSNGWRLDVTAFPDQVFAESSFYAVDWSVPAGLTLASSGTETGQEPAGDLTIHHILAGPVREFAATAGARYRQETRQVAGISVRSTALLTDTAQASQDLGIAATALALYSRLFGPYPFNDFDLVLTPDGGGGIEFPGYVMISHLRPTNYWREHVVSHEVAHQWWYSLVGDDIFREPWLDESFADYTTYLYLQQTAGQAVADNVFQEQTAGVWPGFQGDVATANPFAGKRVGSAIWEFRDFDEYDGIIYGKGPVFLDRLRRVLGDDRFFRLLQTHYARNKYGITTGRTFLREAEELAGPDAPAVESLYLAWVEGRRP
ncbi:MAG TPA: M1 family aminopeptidase [Chloroflexia bacterium]|nr:M1 family aminopeptidase [Chloroflexia bacterium]